MRRVGWRRQVAGRLVVWSVAAFARFGPTNRRAVLAAMLPLALVACATATATGDVSTSGVGRPAPEIVVERLNGKRLSLSSLRGKVVLLDVWASWCGPCKQELPMLDAIAVRLRARGVEVLAVSVDQERENVVKFLGSRSHWSLTVAHDPRGAIADTFQPDKMPTSYVIDREGIVRAVNSGFEPADAPLIEKRLADLAGDGIASGDRNPDREHHEHDNDGPDDKNARATTHRRAQ